MGYRSEVKSLIYGTKEQMAKFNNENVFLLTVLSADFGKDLTHNKNDKYVIIFLGEVIRWLNLLSLAQDAGLITEFVRIGEDSEGDIETDYTGDCAYYLQTECHIVANF